MTMNSNIHSSYSSYSSPRRAGNARRALAPISFLLVFQPPPSPLLVRAFRCGVDDNTIVPSFRRRRQRRMCHQRAECSATPFPPSSSSHPTPPSLLLHRDDEEGVVASRNRRPRIPDDWEYRSLGRKYRNDGGVLYKTSALSRMEYATVCDELKRLYESSTTSLEDEGESSSFATRRKGMNISRSDSPKLYGIFEDEMGGMLRLVNAVTMGTMSYSGGNNAAGGEGGEEGTEYCTGEEGGTSSSSSGSGSSMILAPDVPIEVRDGKRMRMKSYSPPQTKKHNRRLRCFFGSLTPTPPHPTPPLLPVGFD
jgi:hypothetical protein